ARLEQRLVPPPYGRRRIVVQAQYIDRQSKGDRNRPSRSNAEREQQMPLPCPTLCLRDQRIGERQTRDAYRHRASITSTTAPCQWQAQGSFPNTGPAEVAPEAASPSGRRCGTPGLG